jgi:hypothetical protein
MLYYKGLCCDIKMWRNSIVINELLQINFVCVSYSCCLFSGRISDFPCSSDLLRPTAVDLAMATRYRHKQYYILATRRYRRQPCRLATTYISRHNQYHMPATSRYSQTMSPSDYL